MLEVNLETISKIREKTGFGMMDCKKAFLKNDRNFDKTVDYLKNQPESLLSLVTTKKF